jgi:ABC-type uncharacterized transport system auxiliary subunit
MRIRPAVVLLTIASSLVVAGCFGKVKYPTYYALQLPPVAITPTNKTATGSIAVHEFRSQEYLRRGTIVYRPSAEEVAFYEYHRWATEPPKTVTEAVVNHLRASGSFTQVKSYDGRSDVDYVLTGKLERLDEVDYGDGVKVEVALSAELTDSHSGKTVWQDSASETAMVDKREISGVVSMMSQATDRAINKLIESLITSASTKSGL